jgi:hypothetical protein
MPHQFVRAIQSILAINPEQVYPNCRNSLLHKIFQDATYRATSEWKHRHPSFYWSIGAVEALKKLKNVQVTNGPDGELLLTFEDVKEAHKLLRHEHIIPTGLVIRHLLSLNEPSYNTIINVLNNGSRIVCIVTPDENKRLHKTKMPTEHSRWAEGSPEQIWERYISPRNAEGGEIFISQYSCSSWDNNELTLDQSNDMSQNVPATLRRKE